MHKFEKCEILSAENALSSKVAVFIVSILIRYEMTVILAKVILEKQILIGKRRGARERERERGRF